LEAKQQIKSYPFLQGGGEMGELIRSYNWSQSSVGTPQDWPQSLRTTVSNILRSKFPMFLWWGKDMIQFYNDAYRPSFGNEGKHPSALGAKGKDTWSEIWDIISPLHREVESTGEATWRENQLVPIYRNGRLEDVYWTFSYSSVLDDDGKHSGILVTCMETTETVKAQKRVQESEARFRTLFETMDQGFSIIEMIFDDEGRPVDSLFLEMNSVFEQQSGFKGAVGKRIRDIVPDIEDKWFEVYGKVALTGEAVRFTDGSEALGRWFDIYAYPSGDIGNRHVAVLFTDVTEQTLSRKLLEESEARFRNAIEQAPVAIGLTRGEDFVFESINPPMLLLIAQKSKVGVLGKKVKEVLPELQGQAVYDILQHVLKTGEPFHGSEVPVKLIRDGILQIGYFDLSYTRIVDTSETDFLLHMAMEVTDQVAMRRKTENSETKYRTLFESMDQGFCIIEMIFDDGGRPIDYRFLEINPVFETQTGLKDAAGKRISELVPGHEAYWFETYGKVALTGVPIRFEQHAAAMNRWYDVYAFRREGEGDNKVAILFTDITQRKASEEAIKHSEANLRNMILQSPIAIAILKGPSFVIEIANARMFELWGRSPDELQNKSIFEGLPEVKDQGYEQLLAGVYKTGKSFSALGIPVTLPRSGGIETVYINLLYEAFREADGSVSGIMAVATDVTEQVLARQKIEEVVVERTKELAQANETLKIINKELQRSNENLEEFAHAASHDLKEPVRKIRFFTTQLKEQLSTQLKETDIQALNRIENASERMRNLIDDLLLYSHVSQRPHEKEIVDLYKKVQNVLEELELDIEEKKATIHVGSLPLVKGYRRQLQQLFQNLISNAVKYSKDDVPPEIIITSDQIQKNGRLYHSLKITDNGIGFDPAYADKIFQMFTRLHGKAEYSGTGVGLSIVKKVVENHNGFIGVESSTGNGATFNIYLPVEQ
jgi:PAS domain S-box-containing protein